MSSRFVIPLQREDLTGIPEEEGQIKVDNVYSIREIASKLKDVEVLQKRSGCDFVLREGSLDVLYSVLALYHKDLSWDCKGMAFHTMEKALVDLEKGLDRALGQDTLSAEDKQTWLNKLKMLVYFFCQLMEMLDGEEATGTGEIITGRGKRKASAALNQNWSWTLDKKQSGVNLLYRLAHLNLALLFDPPVVEEDFINVMATCLFRFLENPAIALQKSRDLRLSISQLLGTLNSRFNYSLSCRLKIVQSLRHFEHLATTMAEAVEMFAVEYNCSSIVLEIVRDICQISPSELQRDTSGTRAYATFLTELAERQPDRLRPCLSLLMIHLDGESSTMRKSVLTILGEIICRTLGSEDLDQASKENRDQYLDCLEDHVHDVHANVRSSILQIWGKLCQGKTIPLNRQQKLLKLVIGRLQDKSSNVRKQAVQLLTTLLQCNPYTSTMSEDLAKKLEEVKAELARLEKESGLLSEEEKEEEWEAIAKQFKEEDSQEDEEKVWENATQEEVLSRLQHLMQKGKYPRAKALLQSARSHFPNVELFGDESIDVLSALKAVFLAAKSTAADQAKMDEITSQTNVVNYLQDAVNFANALSEALPTVCMLLGSKQISDILEAVNFFVSAFEFGFLQAMVGVRQMLSLVWSREATVKDGVVAAYKRLYLDVEAENEAARNIKVVNNFIALVSGATVGELASLEELVTMLVKSGDLNKECFQVLWQIFTKMNTNISDEDSRSALVLLGMIASAEPAVISSNMSLLIRTGLTERGLKDFQLSLETCVALCKVKGPGSKDINEPPLKFDSTHEVFESIQRILVDGIKDLDTNCYIPMSQKAVMVVYHFAESPDTMCGDILKRIYGEHFQGGLKPKTVFTKRFVSLVGHVAVCQLNHLDCSILSELKRRKNLRDQREEKKKQGRRKSSIGSSSRKKQEDDDMEVIGAEADDREFEMIRNVCEKEIINSDTLLSAFAPFVTHICMNPNKYTDPSLRVAASLALAKMMLLSSTFCEANLQVLFTLLEKSEESVLRANLIIATGDLSFRFPNTLEPWTPSMYARLRDESSLVRSNTLTVLTHLILNDMIKVKGQISDMALCIADSTEKIAGLAKHFFSELARKGNALYNVMPDIISRLSGADTSVSEEKFRSIMGYIISLIEKDKHLESLVEKLCHRFRATTSRRQWRDLSFCLALFPFSDKGVKKLQENFACFSDKLHDKTVHQAFQGILVLARKNAKQETKTLIEELESMMETAQAKCMEDHKANRRAAKAAGKEEDLELQLDEEEEENENKEEENDENKVEEEKMEEDQGKEAEAAERVASGSEEKEDEEEEVEKTRRSRRNAGTEEPDKRRPLRASNRKEAEEKEEEDQETEKLQVRKSARKSSDVAAAATPPTRSSRRRK